MGCTQSKNVLDTPVSMHTTSSDAAYAHETSLLDATKQVRRSFNSSRLQSRHRDVFSIFGERGMALDTHDHETSSPVFGAHLLSSPFSASGSVFSTATTASDTERTMVFQNDATDRSIPALGVTYGAYSDKGMRKQNEDRHTCTSDVIANDTYGYFGVYDGHGGAKVAEYLENNLHAAVFDALRNSSSSGTHGSISMEKAITEAFAATDDVIFKNQIESGATALALVVRGRDAVVACVGDSQAVLSANGKARTLSVIHSPDSEKEKERITKAHGVVVKGRIFGLLGVSRAFGDNDFKTSKGDYKHKFDGDLVTAVPHVHVLSVAPDDEFVVLGCDGLFDVMDAQQVVDFVRAKLALHGHVQHACEELVSYAISIGSTDNVTATIVCFNQTVVEEQEQEDDDDEHDDHKRATDHV